MKNEPGGSFGRGLASIWQRHAYLCLRTTLDIADRLLVAAKRWAAEKGTTLTAFVEHALAAALTRQSRGGDGYRLAWRTHQGTTRAGIDVTDRDRLFDAMERAT